MRATLLLPSLFLLSACAAEPPDFAAPSTCPPGMIYIAAATLDLGEWQSCDELPYESTECEGGGMITLHRFTLAAFCIQTFPFPGVEGGSWPETAPDYADMEQLDEALPQLGRRLCDMSELLLAGTGPENWRYPYDPEDWSDSMCDPDDINPEVMGSYPGCESPLGVRDTGVRPTWGVYDESMRQLLDPLGGPAHPPHLSQDPDFDPAGNDYGLVGGAVRTDTFYAPSNFGAHRHALSEDGFVDDDLRICADPVAEPENNDAVYTAAIEQFQQLGQRYAPWLAALGEES